MVAHVARGHRGDGGNEPPNGNPNRILHACESSQPKRRSKGKNINLYDKFSENNKQKLPIEVDDEENQYRFVGDNQSVFVRCISNEVARMVPFHFASWESVPHHYKRGLYPVISNYFNLDRFKGTDDWEGIKLGIRAECANAYRNRKRRCKAHFERVGGYEDTARARSHPPEGVSPEAWESLINASWESVSPDITSSSYVHASEYNELHEQWQEQQRINQEQEQVNQRMQEQLAQLLAMVNKHGSSRQESDGYDESD